MRRSNRSARPNETRNRISAEPITEGLSIQLRGNGQRNFASVTDNMLVEIARTFMREKGIKTRKELGNIDTGLHTVLNRRHLIEQVGLEDIHRDWSVVGDDEVVKSAQKFMKEKGITTREGVKKVDRGLYMVLRRRDLLAQIEFEEVRRKERSWAMMSDEELVKAAQKFMKEKGITTREGVKKADSGLRDVLRKRNLLGQIEFEEVRRKERNWAMMSDEELVKAAQKFMKEKGITTREGVKKADSGLESVLRRRKVLERAFAHIEEKKRMEGLDAVCEALEDFGEDG